MATFDVVSHLHPEVVRQHIRASQAKLNIWKGIDPGPEEYNVELSAALVPVDDGQNFQLRAVFPDVHIDSTGDFFLSVHGVFSMLGDPNVKDIMVHLDVRVDVEEGSPDIHKYCECSFISSYSLYAGKGRNIYSSTISIELCMREQER